ncbi:MAG: LysR family transcriptional regulator [Pseudotabrizicola sp.]|uniref:LysR family transcriptional regulator n=1 Tax=Pseudotabrizicola sp. TaxID=2939647 RepID=UPI002730504A|nr:LysR family transcriptional regulator [Pseudotabrizicola sp.]MDP2080848.1 LysR family transcriptional regulator [Pseudotabrizicola sp.]MDZ7572750.1 LysR family transcriptional regulator [Pseudotabrizicola sp.]
MAEGQTRVTLWGIEVFLAVAEEGTISAAARRLGVSPPAISQQLAAVEATLGAVLLDRAARPFFLTPAGSLFRRHAQVILNTEAEARADLARADLARLSTLRLGMIEDFDAEVTPALLSGLAQEMTECRFLLETGASHRLLDKLEARALDLAVAAELGSEGADAGWREVHQVLTEPFVAVRPKATGDVPLILYSARHLMGRQIAGHLARANQRPQVRFELDSYHAILALVAQGAGWTILTPLALHHAAQFLDALEVQPLPGAPLARSISLSARAGVMGDVPARVAADLRGLIGSRIVTPAVKTWPWLSQDLRLA